MTSQLHNFTVLSFQEGRPRTPPPDRRLIDRKAARLETVGGRRVTQGGLSRAQKDASTAPSQHRTKQGFPGTSTTLLLKHRYSGCCVHLSAKAPGKASLQKRCVTVTQTRCGHRIELPPQLARGLLLMSPWRCLQRHRLRVRFAGVQTRESQKKKTGRQDSNVVSNNTSTSFSSQTTVTETAEPWVRLRSQRPGCPSQETRNSRSLMFNSTQHDVRHAHFLPVPHKRPTTLYATRSV